MARDGEAQALANFVRFVRDNPSIDPSDETLVAVLDAYRKAERARARADRLTNQTAGES